MATLWRGIVGPDLTIYVKSLVNDSEGKEEMARFGGVEIRGDCGGIVVRCLGDGEKKAGVEEKTRRRLGFEVSEYVRGLGAEEWKLAFGRV